MARGLLLIAALGLLAMGVARLEGQMPAGPSTVEMHRIAAAMKFEAPVEGFLKPLNQKFKLRATEVDFEPGGSLGNHLHVGPGIRRVLAGELTVVHAETGKEQVVGAGEYFYESGDQSLRVSNRGTQTAKLLVVELLPATLKGSAMVSMDRRAEIEEQGKNLKKLVCQAD